MSDDLVQRLVIEGSGNAAAVVAKVTESLEALNRQLAATAKRFQRAFGPDMVKPMVAARAEAKTFGNDLAEAADKAARALRGDVQAIAELRAGLRAAVADEKALGNAMRASQAEGTRAARTATTTARNAASARANASADDLRGWRTRQRIKAASERADAADLRRRLAAGRTLLSIRRRSEASELRERERAGNAWATTQRRKLSIMDRSAAVEARRQREADRVEAGKARAEAVATDRRVRDVGRVWRMRERSEAAEARHLSTMRRERAAMRRSALSSGRHAYGHARHALRSVNHPAFESAGFWVTAGAAFGIEAGRHLLESARSIDAATTRFRMMPGISAGDSVKVRANALREGMKIGLDPAEVVRLQTQAMKDELSASIAATLPAVVNAAVQTMGGTIERDGDELAKAVREASTVGWVKDAAGARSLMNEVSGLSTFNGNSPEKMGQFLASGGIGRGKELGWSKEQTLAFGAALNGSGERTGLGSARLMAQLPEIRAQMRDRYVKAIRSRESGEETRATRAAPRLLGYGGVGAMQQAFASPEGVTDFLSRLSQLPEQTRAAIEKGYGLGPQFNAVAAEMGADHGARYKQAFAREKQLSSQTADNDDLSKNSKIWSGSIDFMVGQLKASVEAVQSELGDVIKDDILTPFTGWWVGISEALLNGGMKADLHRAIQDFIRGLGFDDLTAALNALRGSVGTFDVAGFARGLGEGIRSTVNALRSVAGVFGGSGGISAETIGRTAAELFGLSVALRAVSPVLTILGGVVEAIKAIGAMAGTLRALAGLAGMTGAAEGMGAAAGVGLAGALLPVTIAAVAVGAIAVTVANWGEIKDWFSGIFHGPTMKPEDVQVPKGAPNPSAESPSAYWARKNRYLHPSSFDGGDDGEGQSWRSLMTPASYESSDAGDIVRDATVDTARGVVAVKESVDRLASVMRTASTGGQGAGSGDGGGSGGAGLSNMRYGRTSSGAYRSSPGGRGAGGGSGMTAVSKDLTPESRALLDTLASGEAPDYNVMNGGGRFSDYSHHPGGRAAGRYQFLPSTWRRVSGALGLHDFSPESQDKGAWWLAQSDYRTRTGRDLQADLRSKDPARIAAVGRALHSTWVSLNGSFGGKYASYLGRQSNGGVAGGGSGGSSAPGHIRGNLKIGDETFQYGSGGNHGAASIPFGDYPINPDAQGAWGRAHNAMAVNGSGSIWDKSLGRMRTGIEMHAASTAEMVTSGCLGFMRDQYPKLKARVREMIAKTGHAYLHVGLNGASITPDRTLPAADIVKRSAPSKASDIASKVHSGGRPRPGTGDAPGAPGSGPDAAAASGRSADARTIGGHTFNFYHQVSDPEQHARAVGRVFEAQLGGRTHDVDYDTV